jgi:hypothetical protein
MVGQRQPIKCFLQQEPFGDLQGQGPPPFLVQRCSCISFLSRTAFASILRAEVAVAAVSALFSGRQQLDGLGESGLQWPDYGFIGAHCFSGSVMCMCWCYVVCHDGEGDGGGGDRGLGFGAGREVGLDVFVVVVVLVKGGSIMGLVLQSGRYARTGLS